ncbi:hypothetical protein [Pasteurella testudinis]|uniref:hypothetical protein n=1 Tax=Pasteurella testudinis TaxID=761 RepID=UPI000E06028D|nr:hypothetical protein [Pasteurella testudinis]SUB51634.1 Uncharacterised protein [Pasteurella testudinis]
MSDMANWSYTAKATIWHTQGENDETGKVEFSAPIVITCDYGGSSRIAAGDIGREFVRKDTVWTEYAEAKKGDYLLIGESTETDPHIAGADEIKQILRYADTFNRQADDYALITGA